MPPSLSLSDLESKSQTNPQKIWKKNFHFFFTFQLFSGNPNAANLAADGLNLNSWLSAFYPVPNLRLQIQQETFFEK